MADTARSKENEREYFDSSKQLDAKVTKLAQLVKSSKHFVAFTGAGISTSCGISDFRSGVDTVLDVGPGVWAKESAEKQGIKVDKPKKQVKMLSALPSITHMALVGLCNKDKLKFIISQNVDGLHRRSGIPASKLSELHGNTNLEVCIKCNHYYLKDFHVRTSLIVDEHKTGRKCELSDCDGDLKDTIINFGETLPMDELEKAQINTNTGDLCLALGSSLTVTPAADFAKAFGESNGKNLVIVNLQRTSLDHLCAVRIFAKCDDVMKLLMDKLKYNIPEWRLVRYINVQIKPQQIQDNTVDSKESNESAQSGSCFEVAAVEEDGTPSSLFKSVVLRVGGKRYFIGDPEWRENEDKELPKKQQIEIMEKAFKKLNKHLPKFASMIYDAGYHTLDSLAGLSMDKACDIMDGSNNYERRLIVDKYYKTILDLCEGHDLKHDAKFKDVSFVGIDNEDEKETDSKEFSLELEFAKHYDEKNLLIDLSKFVSKTGKESEEFILKLMYNPFNRSWEVQRPSLNKSLQLDIIKISYINSTICQTILAYRGPGDIVAFSTNGRLSSIEIYNIDSIDLSAINPLKHDDNKDEEKDAQKDKDQNENKEDKESKENADNKSKNVDVDDYLKSDLEKMSDNLCFKEVHTNMKFNSNSTNYSKDKVIRTWHPTLCSTLDYHYIYRIGGGDPLKGLFGESSNNVDYFDLYSMTNKKLPPMKHQRAKCSATILPPNIPFHDYQEIEEEIQDNSAPNLNQLFIEQFKKPRVPPPPMPPIVNMNLDISMDDLLSELNESEQNDQHDDDQEDDETEKEDNKNTNKTQQTTDDKDTETNTNTNTETEQDDNVNIPNGNHTEKEHTKEPEQEEVKQEETQSLHLNGDASPLPNNKEQKPSPTNLSPNISPDTSPQPNVDDGNKSPANLSPNIGPKRVIVKKKMPTTPPPPKPVPKLPPSPNVAPLAPPNGPSNISPNGSPNISPNISPNLAPNKSPSPKQQPIVIVDSTSSPSSTPPQTSPTNSPKSAKIIPPVLNGNAAPLPKGIAAAPPPVISSSNGAAPMPSLPIAPPMAPPIAPPINSIIGNKGTKTVSISSNIPNGNETNSNEPSVNYGGRSRRNSHKSRSESEYPEYCLFVSGGLNGSKLHKKCEIFYPFENSWNPIMSMKQARCGHIAQYMGQTQWKRTVTPSNINGNHLNISMDILEWKDISDLTTKVFVCGGRREHGNGITSCEVYDIENNKWKMCQRAPFTNHGYQSGCWWSNKQCVAMISDPMDGNQIALYKPDINKWNIVGQSNNNKSKQNLKPNNFLQNQPRNDMNLIHFYPLIGTLYLFGQEYLYIMGDDYKFKSLEIYDERANKWIPIGIEYKTLKDDDSIQQKHDQLLKLTNFKQFDSFYSVS